MASIKSIQPRQILDSRGNPTIEVDIHLDNGLWSRAAVPSGASTGSREALELRDNNPALYMGKSVLTAIENINKTITPALLGHDVTKQSEIDGKMLELDGTENKEKLGANAMLAVSLAAARVGALQNKKSLYRYLCEDLGAPEYSDRYKLPAPLMNIINGGSHAANNLDIQEFMIVPHLNKSFSENLRAGVEVFHNLKKVLNEKNLSTNVGDEGGFAPNLKSHIEAIECILFAIEKAGYKPGEDISLSFDAAASEFYNKDNKTYIFEGEYKSSDELTDYYSDLVNNYPVYSIEDGLDESDYDGWINLNTKLGNRILTVGDDLFVTNEKILKRGIENKEANSILIKVNQIGTLTETFNTLKLAFDNDFKAIISHRSGETSDSFIADLAVATAAGHIKTGSASRSDRLSKYNQLLRIEEELADKASYYRVRS